MGRLAAPIQKALVARFGPDWLERKTDVVDRFWDEIEASLSLPEIPYPRVRVYQDALPVCGRELDIVREVAESGSRNHRLLLALRERGATIMGTESPELLIEEYRRIQRLLGENRTPPQASEASPAELVRKRDTFIADRIGATLGSDEVGILFLGMLHSITDLLPADTRPVTLVPLVDNASRIRDALASPARREE